MAQISTSAKRTTEAVALEAAARTPTAALLVPVTLDTLMTEPPA